MSIFGGMSHPTSRLLVGHNTVDVWLTGADIRVSLQNSISLDQLDRPPRRRPHAHPLAGAFQSRRRRHQEPIDHDLLRCPGAASSRRVGPAPHLRTPVRTPRERGPGRAGEGAGLGTPAGGFPARRLALAAQQPGPARSTAVGRIPRIAQRGRDPTLARPGLAGQGPAAGRSSRRSTSTSLRADRRTIFAPCST